MHPAPSQARGITTHQHVVHCKQARVQQAHDALGAGCHHTRQPGTALVSTHIRPQHAGLVQGEAVQWQQLQRLGQDELDLFGCGVVLRDGVGAGCDAVQADLQNTARVIDGTGLGVG